MIDSRRTLANAPTEYIDAGGVTFAYRRLGTGAGQPLILLQHFTGTMDSWDPAVVDGLAEERPVVVFDNTGVGRSSGRTPDTVEQMAADATAFIKALQCDSVDLLGFSLGGMVAQVVAAHEPSLVRKLLLVGTAPQGGEEHLLAVFAEAQTHEEAPDVRLPLMFTASATSQSAGLAFIYRTRTRTVDRDPDSGEFIVGQQAKALIGWCAAKDTDDAYLKAIRQPVLIVSGKEDTMLPAVNAYKLFEGLANAQLILYSDAGHGALFQFPDRFVRQAAIFLAEP
jgi:pimeloyl-ACP methyl ester carboxylesterase